MIATAPEIILINVAILSAGVLGYSKEIAEKNPKLAFLNKTTFKRVTAVLLVVVTLACSKWKEAISSRQSSLQQATRDSLLRHHEDSLNKAYASYQQHRDAEHQSREDSLSREYSKQVDSSYNKSIKSSNEALAKYSLELKDSLRRVARDLNFKATPDPQLTLIPVIAGSMPPAYITSEGKDTLLALKFEAKGSSIHSAFVDMFIFKQSGNSFDLLWYDNVLYDNLLVLDRVRTSQQQIPQSLLNEEILLVFLHGNFKKTDNDLNPIPYSQSFSFNFKENKLEGMDAVNKAVAIEYLRKKGLIK